MITDRFQADVRPFDVITEFRDAVILAKLTCAVDPMLLP